MCGIFGMTGHKEAARLTYLGLYALQHRGEESSGIAVYNKGKMNYHKGMGLVGEVFNEKVIKSLRGSISLGHVRYSTTGSSTAKNIQPFFAKHKRGYMAIAHNGNFINTAALHRELEDGGSIFQTSMDSEIVTHLIARSQKKNIEDKVIASLQQLKGAYSLILMLDDVLVGARDSLGFRPLCLGKLDGAYILASETCALDLIDAEYVRDIEPGEAVFIRKGNINSVKISDSTKCAFCIFEYIYFSRPDSNIFTKNVYLTRKSLGRRLAREYPIKCDIVMPIPDSGNYAALGFAEESGLPLEMAMIRNHYIGRTFIQPSQFIRDFKVKVKLNPVKDVLRGKRIAIIEDSIVRGTTCRARVKTLREVGIKEVHMAISCPPIKSPCYYGIDFPTKKELIAFSHTTEQIKDYIGLDSLKYLSLEGMLKSMPLPKEKFCTACFTEKYPTNIPKRLSKTVMEKRRYYG